MLPSIWGRGFAGVDPFRKEMDEMMQRFSLTCQADDFRLALDRVPHPVYVHSRRGAKAAAFAIIGLALQHGWTGARAVEMAGQLGLPCTQPRLRQFIRHYVDVREMSRFVVAGAVVD